MIGLPLGQESPFSFRCERARASTVQRPREPQSTAGGTAASSAPSRPPSRGAFTLVELLVVIAILGILSTLLLPALARAKSLARAVVCAHHLRQWGVATHLYAGDHDDRLPPEGAPNPTDRQTNIGWYIQLPRELRLGRYHDQPWRTNPTAVAASLSTLWLCPANSRRSNGLNLFHYCLNQNIDGTGDNEAPVCLSSLPGVAELVWLFDSKNLPAVGQENFVHTNLHQGGAQFLFLDGHCRRFRASEYWDPARNRARTNPPSIRWRP